jgi:hypothetical protein
MELKWILGRIQSEESWIKAVQVRPGRCKWGFLSTYWRLPEITSVPIGVQKLHSTCSLCLTKSFLLSLFFSHPPGTPSLGILISEFITVPLGLSHFRFVLPSLLKVNESEWGQGSQFVGCRSCWAPFFWLLQCHFFYIHWRYGAARGADDDVRMNFVSELAQ